MIYIYELPLFLPGKEEWMVLWNRADRVREMVRKQPDCQGIQAHDGAV